MSKKNIIIVGYPKSGTTWLSRLVAELASCPLKGDWGFDHLQQPYGEGNERKSEFECFKSHHTYDTIAEASDKEIYKIIYVIRDPRDIVISGVHFFDFIPKKLQRVIKALPKGGTIYTALKKPLDTIWGVKSRKKQMINAVIYGSSSPNQWLETSWNDHYKGYQNTGVHFVKYEELITNTSLEASKIMSYLDIEISNDHLEKSIHKHSFNNQKKIANTNNNEALKKNMRKGSYAYWKEELTPNEIALFKNKIVNDAYSF